MYHTILTVKHIIEKYAKFTILRTNLNMLNNITKVLNKDGGMKMIKILNKTKVINVQCKFKYNTYFLICIVLYTNR